MTWGLYFSRSIRSGKATFPRRHDCLRWTTGGQAVGERADRWTSGWRPRGRKGDSGNASAVAGQPSVASGTGGSCKTGGVTPPLVGESVGQKITVEDPVVNVMRFDAEAGEFVLGVREESVQLLQGMGTICLQMGLEVKAPTATKAGRVLALQTDLYGIGNSYQRMLVGRGTELLSFTTDTGVERPVLKFLLTSAQLHAINEARDGDLRMELEVTGTLPQAPASPAARRRFCTSAWPRAAGSIRSPPSVLRSRSRCRSRSRWRTTPARSRPAPAWCPAPTSGG